MPRSVSTGIAAALSGLLLFSACRGDSAKVLGRPPATGPLSVKVTCDNDTITTGLLDANGEQAWTLSAHEKDPVEWKVDQNVTSIKIEPKGATPLPFDAPAVGNGHGQAAKSIVKQGAHHDPYSYKITVTCQPTNPAKGPMTITIDPDMIII